MFHRYSWPHLITLLVCLPAFLWAAEPTSLSSLLLKARDANPDVQAAQHSWKVKLAEVSPNGAWPDPTFSFIDEQFPSGIAGVDPEHIKHYRVEQMIPFPGKLTNESRMKYHEALIEEAKYRATTLEVFRDVKARYYQLYLTDRLISLAQQSVDVMKQALGSAQARLAAGQASAFDAFMAQTELKRLENMLFEQKQARTLVQIELNTLLNQSTDAVLGPAQPPELKDVTEDLAHLQKVAGLTNPLYLAAMHEINHSRAMMTHHALQFLPDFGVMVERESGDAGPAGRQIGVSVTFPLWLQRPIGLYRSAKEHLSEAEASSQAMRNMVLKNVHAEYTETNTYLTQARNYESSILPAAQSTLKIAQRQYASGQGDFLRLIESFRTWIQTNNEYQDKLYQYGLHWGELERWLGVPPDRVKEALEQHEFMPTEMNHAK
jgi:cobalt-zinc-cadmium efflux system outer membrane protein